MNKYKCEEHKLDLACLGCVKALVARHDKMLEFVKELSDEFIGWDVAVDAKKILKEIGMENE